MLDFKQKMELNRMAGGLKREIKSGELSLKERIAKTKELAGAIKKLKVKAQVDSVELPKNTKRVSLGDKIPNVTTSKEGALYTFKRDGYDFPITAKMASDKSYITLEYPALRGEGTDEKVIAKADSKPAKKQSAEKIMTTANGNVINLSKKTLVADDYRSMVRHTNRIIDQLFDYLVRTKDSVRIMDDELEAERLIRQEEGAKGSIARLTKERDIVERARELFIQIDQRESEGKDATPDQIKGIEEALGLYPPANAVPAAYPNIWKYQSKIDHHLELIDTDIAKEQNNLAATESGQSEQEQSELIKRFKGGGFNQVKPAVFIDVMRDVHSEGLSLDEVKSGAIEWLNANPDLITSNQYAA